MSIIQEALKKAQGNYTEKEESQAMGSAIATEPPKEEIIHPEKEKSYPKSETHIPHRIKKITSTRLPALIGVLLILLLAYGLKASIQYSKPHDKGLSAQDKVETTALKQESNTIRGSVAKLSDTFNPANLISSRPATFVLNGIMYVEKKPQAIINGNILEEGDKINGATVLVIERDCVLLDLNDANIKLELGK